ncbi:bifunctional hydroxymethylpyrimidine kinase/phosphomethylpyrimidine kinase [Thermoclostridium stercorarium]|uniref:bifunctional hydroxymethylpyrimidine kinase/phosphomethylpyrimidine kinase n=1 Tax=Thermoclostridium stercorarium TaxID=1510 RepID=UPI000A63DEFA|nr:bifunctional hydroxymethylpyrimidine kinase/phosphomethylpyrimidine kinase [Thermoclostridium stercorarium]
MKTVLTIAGSDPSGGAGIQADIKTMTANGVYAMSAITALTAGNTTGVSGIMEVTPEFLGMQLDSIFTDIYPDAVKIGMVSSAPLIEVIAEKLKYYNARNIVVDPVMVCTSGSKVLKDDAIEPLMNKLFPLAVVITPNIPEASILSGISIENKEDMIIAAEIISKRFGLAVLCKGGYSGNHADDLLYCDNRYKWFRGERINNKNTHGTGCTLSSAIACGLAKGMDLETAIQSAKDYVTGALKSMLKLGKGNGL